MPEWVRPTLAGVCSAALLTAGCTDGRQSSASGTPSGGACPATRPTERAIPAGVSEQGYGPVFGEGSLWVGAWWAQRPMLEQLRAQRPRAVKYPSFTVRDGQVTNALGPPRIRAERLDGTGEGSADTGGYATATQDGSGATLHWWPTVVTFPSAGCWRVTETVADTTISYVVRI